MKNPLVSVICLCYNQSPFVGEALESVVSQSYDQVELIIVDDCSTDGSKEVIENWLKKHKDIPFIDLVENLGNTTAFNRGLSLAKGKYVIDLAADDILNEGRLEKQVAFFESQQSQVGVIYSDALYIDEKSNKLNRHFSNNKLTPFEGDIYSKLIDTYFIPTPTMMIRKKVLEDLGGYDENLAYEDFDFWIRSARDWEYGYQSEALTLVRILDGSQSTKYYKKSDKMLGSTVAICSKIAKLNKTEKDNSALVNRLKYEIRHAFLAGKKMELELLFEIWMDTSQISSQYMVIKYLGKAGLNLTWLKKPIQFLLG